MLDKPLMVAYNQIGELESLKENHEKENREEKYKIRIEEEKKKF